MSGNDLDGKIAEAEKKRNAGTTKKASGVEAIILFIVIAGVSIIAISSVILLIVGIKNPTFLGMGIMGFGIVVYITSKMYRTVPQKQEWVIEIFGRYYKTWEAGLHFLIPGIMTVRGKITVDSTKIIKLFMRGDDQLDFKDDSAELTVEIRAKTTESEKPTYQVIFTDDEIKTIEADEEKKGNTLLPEDWMYLTRIRVESAMRGICGQVNIDSAIESISSEHDLGENDAEATTEDKNITQRAQDISNEVLEDYGIIIEEVLITNLKLSKETEAARREIHIEAKGVDKRKQILKQKEVEAKMGKQEGLRIREELNEIIAPSTGKDDKEVPSGLNLSDAMNYKLGMKATEKIGNVTILSGSESDKNIPLDIAARFGAAFGTGNETVKSKKKRTEEKDGD